MFFLKKLTKNQKIFFLLILIIPIVLITVSFIPLSPIPIAKGDLIKNFRFVSYTDNSKGVFTDRYNIDGGKLQVEWDSNTWSISNTQVINKQTVNNTTYMRYRMLLTNDFNFYTNIPITSAAQGIYQVSYTRQVYRYRHMNCYNDEFTKQREYGYLRHYYYSWGSTDFRTWNTDRHIYSGEFKFDFDLNKNPLGSIGSEVTGDDGDVYELKFAYMTVNDMEIMTSSYGAISKYNLTDTAIGHQSSGNRASTGGLDGDEDETLQGHKFSFDVNARFDPPYISNSWDAGVMIPSSGGAIDFLTKDGKSTWNPEEQEKGMDDCSFTLPLIRISPYVTEYSRRLKYDKWELKKKDGIPNTWTKTHSGQSTIKPSALTIDNRNINYRILMILDIWTAFELEVINSGLDGDDLDKPADYYDQLAYSSAATGTEDITKTISKENLWCQLFGICTHELMNQIRTALIMIIITIISIVGLVIVVKILIARKAAKTGKGIVKRIFKK